jgi:hypothetical protein
MLGTVRQSASDFTASVKENWPKMPAAGAFAEVGRNEKLRVACPMSGRVQTLMQSRGENGVTEAARDLARENTALEAAVSSSLGLTPLDYSRECLSYLQKTTSPS